MESKTYETQELKEKFKNVKKHGSELADVLPSHIWRSVITQEHSICRGFILVLFYPHFILLSFIQELLSLTKKNRARIAASDVIKLKKLK